MKETSDMQEVKDHARLLYNPEEVESALDRMAGELAAKVSHSNPILLAVMNGGLILLGMLLPRLDFPLRVDYLHATRYRERTFGTDLQWKKTPEYSLAGETVVVVDDICRVPCDYIPKRSYPLFRTRQILNDWLTQNLEEA